MIVRLWAHEPAWEFKVPNAEAALATCRQLVYQNEVFTVALVPGGWFFRVKKEVCQSHRLAEPCGWCLVGEDPPSMFDDCDRSILGIDG